MTQGDEPKRRVCRDCGAEKDLDEFVKARGYKDGRRSFCKTCWAAASMEYKQATPGSFERQAAASKRQRDECKEKVLDRYGRACSCCGEACTLFLTVEHLDGGGRKHRRTMGTQTIYVWLVNNGFPEGFTILCYNCNCVKRVNGGVCPHQEYC